jgi:hypothetical protein
MTDDTPLPFDLPAVHRKKLTVDFDGGTQSSDAGLLLLREAERKLGVCRRLAAAMPDRRDPDRILHAMFEMVMERVSAIACGYKDAIDLDRLRHDPLMKVAVGRCPETGAPLASQSTISRLENSPSKTDAARPRHLRGRAPHARDDDADHVPAMVRGGVAAGGGRLVMKLADKGPIKPPPVLKGPAQLVSQGCDALVPLRPDASGWC